MTDAPSVPDDHLLKLLELDIQLYTTRQERSALRGALTTAAALCDVMATRCLDEYRINTGRRVIPKPILAQAETYRSVGDQIMRLRDLVHVPHDQKGAC